VSPRRAKPTRINAAPPTASSSNPFPGPVKASEPELADVIPDDVPPDAAAVATRALVVDGSPVGEVVGAVVCGGLAVVGIVRGSGANVVGVGAVVGAAVIGAAVVGGAVIGGAVVGAPVVGGADVAEVAIVGDSGEPVGALATMPVDALLLGYAMQDSESALPDTSSVSLALLSSLIEMGPPDAVNGPTVPAVAGITRSTPDDGTGFGSTALKLIDPVEIEGGVAPLASTAAVAVPAMSLLPSAAAADAIEDGIVTWVW
jgi:hypothetical protein